MRGTVAGQVRNVSRDSVNGGVEIPKGATVIPQWCRIECFGLSSQHQPGQEWSDDGCIFRMEDFPSFDVSDPGEFDMTYHYLLRVYDTCVGAVAAETVFSIRLSGRVEDGEIVYDTETPTVGGETINGPMVTGEAGAVIPVGPRRELGRL